MGLDTSHGCWHGAYSAFTRWRHKIAEVAGYAVWSVVYDDGIKSDTIMLDWGHVTEENLAGKWNEMPSDPLILIFAHSDCHGELPWQFCAKLAERLEEIMPLLPDGDAPGHIGNWRYKTQEFIDGLKLAHKLQENVNFH